MTYPNLTTCSSGSETWICIFLVPLERRHIEVCGNVKGMLREYNTIDLVKDNTKKKTTIIFEMQEEGHNVVQTAQDITGAKFPAIQDLYTRRCQRKA
jgi:hypothetical protein